MIGNVLEYSFPENESYTVLAPSERWALMEKNDEHLALLGWDWGKLQKHLGRKYCFNFRSSLSDEQLIEFCHEIAQSVQAINGEKTE